MTTLEMNQDFLEVLPVVSVISAYETSENKALKARAEQMSSREAREIVQAYLAGCMLTPLVFKYMEKDGKKYRSFLTKYKVPLAFKRFKEDRFNIYINGKHKFFSELNDEELSILNSLDICCLRVSSKHDNPNFIYYMEQM